MFIQIKSSWLNNFRSFLVLIVYTEQKHLKEEVIILAASSDSFLGKD